MYKLSKTRIYIILNIVCFAKPFGQLYQFSKMVASGEFGIGFAGRF